VLRRGEGWGDGNATSGRGKDDTVRELVTIWMIFIQSKRGSDLVLGAEGCGP
jgi:hypothetical protein